MKTPLSSCLRRLLMAALVSAAFAVPALRSAGAAPTVAKPTINAPVTVADTGDNWTLDNGIVKMTVLKRSGKMTSLVYQGQETLNGRSESWEQLASGEVTPSLTIDPAKNGGQRAEVAVKGVTGGGPAEGAAKGAKGGGRPSLDIELRYTLERGVSGFYTYAIYSHPASYGAMGEGESRFINQLTPSFDWLSVDADRNMPMCSNEDTRSGVVIHAKEQRILSTGIYKNSVEHKYSYCAEMYKLPAYGWSSIKDHVGIWFINPANEYLGGGPTRIDLVCHMGATMLDYWTSGHYAGGAACNIPAGEVWNKVVGPIFVYCNSLQNAQTPTPAELDTLKATEGNPTIPAAWTANANALFNDALAQAKITQTQWPYAWVQGVDYPQKAGRATVAGQFALNDPQAPSAKLPHLWVGLTHPDFNGAGGGFAQRSGNGTLVTWDHDANYYQFWAEGSADGRFTIANVRPGTYTMHAFADGVLGEFAKTDITVAAGKAIDLGKLEWKPVRYGKQVWEIGYPDRTGGKFFKGDGANYWLWGWGLRYSLLFPNDITYTIGKSDYHKDWFFQQVPHSETAAWVNPEAKDPANQRFGWMKAATGPEDPWRLYGRGRATTWTIKFNFDHAGKGLATLRLALAGSDGNGGLAVAVNGKDVGTIRTIATNALRYNTDKGIWRQYTQPFDAALLKSGENEMTLTVPAGDVTSGVVYDYLRLELNENPEATTPKTL
jgi:rhamnogalacturonan endolyase